MVSLDRMGCIMRKVLGRMEGKYVVALDRRMMDGRVAVFTPAGPRSSWQKQEYRVKRMEVGCSRKEDIGIERYVEGSRRDMVEWVMRVEEVQAPQSIDQQVI